MQDLLDILSGKKNMPEIPFSVEFETKSLLKLAGVSLATAIIFVLLLKAINK
ncbi:hypothetical protein FACS1894153_0320 [Bacteroidia bacterium]|nr:hypothetical protein FACS1894153_0320 [Bacteroidia bacterium]